jgi:autotransporter-associated beta strand protein
MLRIGLVVWAALFWPDAIVSTALGNPPGGTNGTAANVTLVNNGNGTVTMGNGIVSVLCTTSAAKITQINYTYNNGGGNTTQQLLNGGYDSGELYWELGGFGTGAFTYSVVADPSQNSGNYAEIGLLSSSASAGSMEVHFSMLRGSTGFYVTAIWSHRGTDPAMTMGETRDNIYAGSIFNWMCVDEARNRLMEVSGGTSVGVFNAPVEVSLWTTGLYQGQYEDKYKYSADLGVQRAWGWCSVGGGGKNVGLWNVSASAEYYNGGPMKRELMCHIGTMILNMLNGSHYGGGTDASWAANEAWTKVYGPYFIYCNNVSNNLSDPVQASGALYADALAQAAAELTAWPYAWFTNASHTPASGRGAITGTMVIADSGNPDASAADLWVGVVQQPSTTDAVYDFQEWMKPYQFWIKSDTNGNFTIPNVIAGTGYTLYAFGPGAAGTFQSHALTGGAPPNTVDIPAAPFTVTVTAGATNNLGNVIWTPARVGATVFEIGYPNRKSDKFRHGDDFWLGDIGPSATAPSPIWAKHLEYPLDFPTGPKYAVGQSRWSTDWNFVQPIVTDNLGNFNGSTSTITFNLASAPASGSQASFYMALCSDFQGPMIIQVNGTSIAGSTGYFPAYSSSSNECDTTIRQGQHGCFSDNRISFAGNLLKQGQNTITLNMRKGGYFANHAMYDYIRLELTGYVPPAPASVAAYAGNNCNLISWPVTPGATSYNILNSTTSGSGYAGIATGVTGPVCGSGPNNATYLDTKAVNGTTHYYVVRSVNPTGASGNSPQSAGVTPSAGAPATAPGAPTGLAATKGDGTVTLTWNASAGANYYTIQRSTVVNSNGTVAYTTLNNTNTGATYVDTTPSNGSTYDYIVSATSAGGTSANSAAVTATPVPPAPASPPNNLTVTTVTTSSNQLATLRWSAVTGAVGYIIERSTSLTGPFSFPNNYVMSITETTYTDTLSLGVVYFYVVIAVNAGGVSANSAIATTGVIPAAPGRLTAIAGNAQVTLIWPAVTGAASYVIKRGTSPGNENTTVATVAGSNYNNTGLLNGTTYYYVVAAVGTGGAGANSPEANATPSAAISGSLWTWTGTAGAAWDTTTSNWVNGGGVAAYGNGDAVIFDDQALATAVAITSAVSPASVTFANSTANYTVSAGGAGISGGASIVKTNSGTVTLSGANSYTGGTTVGAGELRVTGSLAGGGAVVVANGGALSGTGTIAGPVTIQSGGVLAPGGGLRALTFGSWLTLAAGSTNTFEISPSPSTNDSAVVLGALTNGGALLVTNVSAAALAENESFKLFNAASYNGAFARVVLPPLPAGLGWNTNLLNTAGALSVVVATQPVIGPLSHSASGLVFTGTGGVANATYYLLGSSNIAAPLSNWMSLATNSFDTNGNFSFTNALNPGNPRLFYMLRLP